jgi:hypothetical protein
VRNFDLDPVIESHQAWFLLFISRIQVCLFGGFLGHGGTPSYQCYSRIFHEINQAAIGDPPWLWKPHLRVAIKLFRRLFPRTANTEAWSASNKAVEKVLRPAERRNRVFLAWAIPSRHHRFQYEKGLMTWMIWSYPDFRKPSNGNWKQVKWKWSNSNTCFALWTVQFANSKPWSHGLQRLRWYSKSRT